MGLSQATLQPDLPEQACFCPRACWPASPYNLTEKASRQFPILSVEVMPHLHGVYLPMRFVHPPLRGDRPPCSFLRGQASLSFDPPQDCTAVLP